MVTTVFETNLSLQDARLNTVMKKLTGWAAIIAVPTAVTGYYGQNVLYPGINTIWGAVTSAAIIVLCVAAVLDVPAARLVVAQRWSKQATDCETRAILCGTICAWSRTTVPGAHQGARATARRQRAGPRLGTTPYTAPNDDATCHRRCRRCRRCRRKGLTRGRATALRGRRRRGSRRREFRG
jgi:hypothetical protein